MILEDLNKKKSVKPKKKSPVYQMFSAVRHVVLDSVKLAHTTVGAAHKFNKASRKAHGEAKITVSTK